MVQSPEERGNSLRRSLSQSDGDTDRGLDANAEVQQRAMQRYQRLLKTDPQLQVMHRPSCRLLSISVIPLAHPMRSQMTHDVEGPMRTSARTSRL